MKWYDACRDSPVRRAERSDEFGDWRITVDGVCEIVASDSPEARRKGYVPDQIYDVPTTAADRHSDWTSV